MKYFIIAGEASGDLHGGNLIRAIKQHDPSASFNFWGGDHMNAEAEGLLVHYKDVTIMGFVEVLMNLRTILGNIDRCKQQIDAFKPDVVVMIDYPGFNLRIAEYCKQQQIRTAYYIAPKVWAWKENRAKKLERFVDKLLLIFPFEVSYFKKWKVNAVFVGNPLLDAIADFKPDPLFRKNNGLGNREIIALMPGSRKQEISKILPKMTEATASYSQYQLVIAGAPGIDPEFYKPYLNERVSIVFGKTYDLLHQSTAAVVCSGTATLETALFNVPQVCGYIANPVSYAIAKLLVKIRYISLVNLNLDRDCITELIQNDFSVTNLHKELDAVLPGGGSRTRMLADYEELRGLLGGDGASSRAAVEIMSLTKQA